MIPWKVNNNLTFSFNMQSKFNFVHNTYYEQFGLGIYIDQSKNICGKCCQKLSYSLVFFYWEQLLLYFYYYYN